MRRRQPGGRVGQHFAVADAERLDPSLLSQGQRNEEAKLDQLGVREMLVQFRPQRRIGDLGIPDDGARVRQCHLLALSELKGIREVQQVVVLLFGQPFPSGLDGTLDASIVALDRLGDVDATQLLDGVIANSLSERELPGL